MNDGRVFPEPEGGFLLHDRVRHVLSEADRVERATEVLRDGDVEAFGRLMNESHASCRDDYGISTPELDSLVDIMREAGALGARLTGAGFGGCAIALVRSEDAKRIIAAVRDRYYRDERGLGDDPPEGYTEWSDVVFATDAGPGATVRNL
jgi:galactokinase